MRWAAWGCVIALCAVCTPAWAADSFDHRVVAVRLPTKGEQADRPELADFYIDCGQADGALPGAEFWVYRTEHFPELAAASRTVAIPIGRLRVFQVEERLSIARITDLVLPADHALVDYRTIMIGDVVEPIAGSGMVPLGERDLPAETIEVDSSLLPPLREGDRALRTVSIPNIVLFDFDRSTLRPEGIAILAQLAAYARDTGADEIRIEGHTCSIGTVAYNQGLSERRAHAVERYFRDVEQLATPTIAAVGFGETQPRASNATEAGRELNRRSVITIEGREPTVLVPDGMAVSSEALVPETVNAADPGFEQPTSGTAQDQQAALAPDAPPPPEEEAIRLPELARPRS